MTFPIFVELAVRMISPGSNLSILIRFTIPPILDARQNSIMIFGDPHFQRGRALAAHRAAISASGNNSYSRTDGNFPLARPQALSLGLWLISPPSLCFVQDWVTPSGALSEQCGRGESALLAGSDAPQIQSRGKRQLFSLSAPKVAGAKVPNRSFRPPLGAAPPNGSF